ncbi:RHS repeat protein [Niabella sp. CC-SYL272]|uniref:RHS repeat domain-containing protein n=1 Tax=Niabella agricola TaxID=2891571 RepID=UPI001F4234AE|nr:RHS repeat domain-containing protein [Niabella agricola]MCF3109425.1 RHS repeat protein [Niabella agricola]
MMKTRIFFLMLLLSLEAAAQDEVQLANLPKVVPASPTAANLGMYKQEDVSYYTGTPNINIPLFAINTGHLNLPISLSYHANGIKVEEMSSIVGLGWNLNAGGSITRSINGSDDLFDYTGGAANYISQTVKLRDVFNNQSTTQSKEIMARIAAKQYDGQPDVFYINCNGLSGKFFYNQDKGGFIFSPNQNVKISYDNHEQSFTLTNTSGIEYTFDVAEVNTQDLSTGGVVPVTTAWFLSKIKDLKSQEELLIAYEPVSYNFETLGVETKGEQFDYFGTDPQHVLPDNITMRVAPYNSNRMSTFRVKRIDFKNGYLLFNKSTSSRYDIVNDYSLNSIEVYSGQTKIRKIDFYQSYFKSDDVTDVSSPSARTKIRLKLDSLKIWDGSNVNSFQPYKFKYYGNGAIVDRLSRAQDYWGYYNYSNGQTMLPPVQYEYWPMPGNDRNANPSFTGTISEISYPTGGFTSFEFEGNQIAAPANPAEPSNLDYMAELLAGIEWSTTYSNGQSQIIIHKSYFEKQIGFDSSQSITVNGDVPALYLYVRPQSPSEIENFRWNADPNGYYPNEILKPEVKFFNVNNPGTNLLSSAVPDNAQGDGWYRLTNVPAGVYKMMVDYSEIVNNGFALAAYCELYSMYNTAIRIPFLGSNPTTPVWQNKYVGGLRIKQILDYPSASSAPLITKFTYNSDQGLSTGAIQFVPQFYYKAAYFDPPMGGSGGFQDFFTYLKRFSMPNVPMAYTQGSHIGYQRVTVEQVNSSSTESQRKIYFFSTFNNYPDDIRNSYPFCRGTNFDWKRGLLESELTFKKEGNYFKLVNQKDYEYKTVMPASSNATKSIGVDAGFMFGDEYVLDVRPDPALRAQYPIVADSYEVISEDFSLAKKTEITFDDNSRQVISSKEYFYDIPALLVPTRVRTKNSKNDSIDVVSKYPLTYNPTAADNAGIKGLVDNNIYTPIEQYEVNLNKNTVAPGQVTYYNGNLNPKEIWALQPINPIPKSNFLESKLVNNVLQTDPNYGQRLKFNLYDAYGNVLEQQKSYDGKEVFLWGYNNQYPVAKIVGSDFATVDLVVDIDLLNNPVSTEAQIRAELNKLRTDSRTKNALVTSYTYRPLIGVTSETDPSGKITFYEYDGLGRLSFIKDEKGNILKTICYNYAGQVVNCNQ